MSAPIKVYIVELVTLEEAKPILVTADREEAESMVEGFNVVVRESTLDEDTPALPRVVLRSGLAFYQASPSPARKEVLA